MDMELLEFMAVVYGAYVICLLLGDEEDMGTGEL